MVDLGSGREEVKMPPYNRRESVSSTPNIGQRERFYPDEWEFGFPENMDDLLEFYDEGGANPEMRYAGPDPFEVADRGMSAFGLDDSFDPGYR